MIASLTATWPVDHSFPFRPVLGTISSHPRGSVGGWPGKAPDNLPTCGPIEKSRGGFLRRVTPRPAIDPVARETLKHGHP